ncbi:major facilitator superfamily transporter [Ceratobasidium sp. AG-Ba]|nr:major facilitator superfamily transporter [Ceratobasidium sp. AG-Ba]
MSPVGVYCSGPFWGRVIDARGPRMSLLVAFCLLLFGYSGIRMFYTGALSMSDDSVAKFNGDVAALSFFGLCTGIAGNAGITSAMNSVAKSFPDRMRASTTGLVASGFGLSAFFFSTFAHALFPGNTAALLLVLALGSSAPMLFGFFFVRPIQAPAHNLYEALPAAESQLSIAEEAEQWDTFSPVEAGADQEAVAHIRGTSRARATSVTRRSQSLVREDIPFLIDGVNTYRGRSRSAVRMSLEIPDRSARESQERGRSVSMQRDFIDATSNVPEVEAVDIHGMALFRTSDFWLLFSILSLLAGTGLMYINNVGSIVQTLLATGNPGWDHKDGIERQATQVSIISIANSAGRLLIGLSADYGKNNYDTPRSYFLIVISLTAIMSQLVLMNAELPDHIWMTSSLLGLAYGATFGLCPVLAIEWFGLGHFSSNWGFVSFAPVLSGNLFNLMFGRNLDKHAATQSTTPNTPTFAHVRGLPSASELQCYDGKSCYVDSVHLSLFACCCALGLSIFAAWRDRRRLEMADTKSGLLWTVEEEANDVQAR